MFLFSTIYETIFSQIIQFLPFSNVENTWALEIEDLEVWWLGSATEGDLLQRPIPVVVIVVAEDLGAVTDLEPETS